MAANDDVSTPNCPRIRIINITFKEPTIKLVRNFSKLSSYLNLFIAFWSKLFIFLIIHDPIIHIITAPSNFNPYSVP